MSYLSILVVFLSVITITISQNINPKHPIHDESPRPNIGLISHQPPTINLQKPVGLKYSPPSGSNQHPPPPPPVLTPAGLCRLFNLRQYSGSVSFVPAPGFESYGESTSYPGKPTIKGNNSDPSEGEHVNLQTLCYQGPEINLENMNWRVINGPFISVWLHNVPWGAEDTMAAPDAKFSDGYLDLIITKNCPKLHLLSMMSELNSGGHVKSPYVTYLKVKAFNLQPGPRTRDQEKEGIIDSDGEVLARGKGTYKCEQKSLMAYDKLQITVDRGLATLFTPI